MQRPPGRGVLAPGRQLAKARATAGYSRVAWPPAQGYTESHPAEPGVPVTLRSAVEQSWYHWSGNLERLPGVGGAVQVVQQPPHLLRTPRGVWVVDVVTVGCLCFLSFYNYTQKKGGVRGQISPLNHPHFALSLNRWMGRIIVRIAWNHFCPLYLHPQKLCNIGGTGAK